MIAYIGHKGGFDIKVSGVSLASKKPQVAI